MTKDNDVIFKVGTILLLCSLCISCVTSPLSKPGIDIVLGSEKINIISNSNNLPSNCEYIGKVQGSDGMVGNHRWHFTGTKERALIHIRNKAVKLRANTVLMHDDETLESIPLEGAKGYKITLFGSAYLCEI